MFSGRFENELYPYSSSVSQDMYDTYKYACCSSLPVTLDPAVRVPDTQPNCDYLSLFHDGGQNSGLVCGQPQMNFQDLSGRERSNSFVTIRLQAVANTLAGSANFKSLKV